MASPRGMHGADAPDDRPTILQACFEHNPALSLTRMPGCAKLYRSGEYAAIIRSSIVKQPGGTEAPAAQSGEQRIMQESSAA
jgi:hypothetical protein